MDKPGMLKVHQYLSIRVAHQKEESQRSIARRLRHSQRTVAKAIASQTGVDYPEGRRKTDVLIVAWSFSHAVFMIALPSQRAESVLHGEGLHRSR